MNLFRPSNTIVPPYNSPWKHIKRSVACLTCLLLSLCALPGTSQAQTGEPASKPSAPKPAIGPKQSQSLTLPTAFSGLDWKTLTPAQQVALKPLTSSWKDLSDPQKRKWISLSANFERMNSGDQAKLHERMSQWAALSPKQREQARLNFAEAQKIAPQQKTEKWEAYQALSPEEKQTLAKSVRPKPPRTALAIQPVAPGKLNQLTIQPGAGPVTIPTASAPAAPASRASIPAPMSASTPSSSPEAAASHETAKP